MYAGTLNASMSQDQDHNLFFWLIKNTTIEKPHLVVWLNGRVTSLFGLFEENGPIKIARNGTGPDDFVVGLRPEGSWLEHADLLYLDQPVGVGFSYGNSVLGRIDDAAKEFIRFLDMFLRKFPEY